MLNPVIGFIGAGRINRHFTPGRVQNKIHIFHESGAQQYFISQNQRAYITIAITKIHFNGANLQVK